MNSSMDPDRDDIDNISETPEEPVEYAPVPVEVPEDPAEGNGRVPIELSAEGLDPSMLEQLFRPKSPRKNSHKGPEQEPVPDAGEQLEAQRETFAAREAELQAEIENLKNNYLRAVADQHNIRRRAKDDMEKLQGSANERLIKEVLPLLDDFERALDAATKSESYEQLIDGVSAIYRKFVDVLSREGITPVPAVGEPFDSYVHEAVMVDEGSDAPADTVTEELRKGYTMHGRLIRPALVKVAKS